MPPLATQEDDALRVAVQVRMGQRLIEQVDAVIALWAQQTGLRMSRAQTCLRAIEEGLKVLLAPTSPAPDHVLTVSDPDAGRPGGEAPPPRQKTPDPASIRGRALAHMRQTRQAFTIQELAAAVGFDAQKQARLLRTFKEDGLVRKEADGRFIAV